MIASALTRSTAIAQREPPPSLPSLLELTVTPCIILRTCHRALTKCAYRTAFSRNHDKVASNSLHKFSTLLWYTVKEKQTRYTTRHALLLRDHATIIKAEGRGYLREGAGSL